MDQQVHFLLMLQAVKKQTSNIEEMEIGGIVTMTSELRSLMKKIRDIEAKLRPLQQKWLKLDENCWATENQKIDKTVSTIRDLISQVQVVKDKNKNLLKQSIDGVRKQLTGLNAHSKVTRAYYRQLPQNARFIDKSN